MPRDLIRLLLKAYLAPTPKAFQMPKFKLELRLAPRPFNWVSMHWVWVSIFTILKISNIRLPVKWLNIHYIVYIFNLGLATNSLVHANFGCDSSIVYPSD
jgi:hypothetical protein